MYWFTVALWLLALFVGDLGLFVVRVFDLLLVLVFNWCFGLGQSWLGVGGCLRCTCF